MWKRRASDDALEVKKMHMYHFQVQAQLHITKLIYCLFTIWTPKGLRVENIFRDDKFWEKELRGKLEKFYMYRHLSEIIAPRRRRSMQIRDPEYIVEAQKKSTDLVLAKPLRVSF